MSISGFFATFLGDLLTFLGDLPAFLGDIPADLPAFLGDFLAFLGEFDPLLPFLLKEEFYRLRFLAVDLYLLLVVLGKPVFGLNLVAAGAA